MKKHPRRLPRQRVGSGGAKTPAPFKGGGVSALRPQAPGKKKHLRRWARTGVVVGFAGAVRSGSWSTNAGLGRNFTVRERYKLRFRADMYNATNHVNYGNPTASINSSTFGQIRSAGGMRSMQMNARLTW